MTKFGPDLPLLFKMHEIWPDDSQENYLNCCHQMSDFTAKMHQIRFRLGLLPDPTGGAHSAPPRPPGPLAGFKGPTSKEGEMRRRREGTGEGPSCQSVALAPWLRMLDPPLSGESHNR